MTFDLGKIDWTALASIFTAMSVAATAWAAWAATIAARAAQAANESSIQRDESRRARKAASIAGPIAREIEAVLKALASVGSARAMGLGPLAMWHQTDKAMKLAALTLTERFADQFDSFDPTSAGRLGSAISAVAEVNLSLLRTTPTDQPPPFEVMQENIEGIVRKVRMAMRVCESALDSLRPYRIRDEQLDMD